MDIEELYNLGESYEEKKDYGEMEKHYLMAVDGGNTKAMIKLGDYYKDLKNHVKMGKYYLMAVEKGESKGMVKMGDYYKDLKDYVKMGEYYLMAIEKKDSEAMVKMGDYHYNYLFGEIAFEILSWYTIARGIPNHILIKYSPTINEHTHEIIKYYSMAIDYGNSDAMNNLGVYYWTIKDYVLMGKYYLMAIENGNSDAMYNLGYYYGFFKIYHEMEKYYLMSLKNDKYNGRRVCDLEQYKKIMNNKYNKSIFNFCRRKENNVEERNFVEIEKEKIKEGNVNSMINLGNYYINKDHVLTGKYYMMAIEKGNHEAMRYLGDFYLSILIYNLKDCDSVLLSFYKHNLHNQIRKYYLMAIEKGDTNAMYNLGDYYENEKNYDEMKKYYLMVLRNNYDFDHLDNYKISKKFQEIKKTYFAETNELQPFI